MDKAIQANLQMIMQTADKVNASQLLSVLDHYAGKISILSLDCFDTLIWRKTAAPRDVFFDLQNRPAFKSKGFTASLRTSSEGKARQLSALKYGSSEVNLTSIYRDAFPNLDQNEIDTLIAEELLVESENCFAFFPVVELIRAAHQRGIKVIIVSDIYFEEKHLKILLSRLLPTDVLDCISRIFCSCDHKTGKTDKLFIKVLQTIGCQPEKILHIGDNIAADYVAPRAFKINALHFVQHSDCLADLLRLQDTSALFLDSTIRAHKPLFSPFRAVLAMNNFSPENPEKLIGYVSLGQIMYSFAQFICTEVEALANAGKKPKVLFLMRDAYLPALACEALHGKSLGKCVRISRFASYAASFCSLDDIDSYLVEIGTTNRFHDVGRQLLLPEKVLAPIITAVEKSNQPTLEFFNYIRRKDIVKIILNKSAEYRARLFSHLRKEVGLEKDDTLVLVDLGYSGTAQRRLTPVLNQIGINVVGRYLLSLRIPGWENNRRGLIDPSWCDDKAMQTVVFYITLLEQLCTSNERSVMDYDAQGNPIFSDVVMTDQQHNKLTQIQTECVNFIKDAKTFFQNSNLNFSEEMFRQIAMTELTRMIFLPTEIELSYLKTFQAEMNLGTQDILRVFDPEQGLMGLRRRGMFYMEKPSKLTRTNYPAELRSAGIELVFMLMAQHRFGLDLKLKDMVLRRETLQVVFRDGKESHKTIVEAVATHDGFFAIWLPANIHIDILFGEKFQWIQVDSVELIKMDAFINQNEAQNTVSAWECLALNQVTARSANLFELNSAQSVIVMQPHSQIDTKDCVLRLVFRPIVKREKQLNYAMTTY